MTHPSTSFSAGAGWTNGRELTAAEQLAFRRRQRAVRLSMIALMIAVPLCVVGVAWLAQQPHVDKRTRFYPTGQKQAELEFVGTMRNGSVVEYFENGVVRARGHYTRDVEDGLWTTYYWNGQPKSEGAFSRGLKDGPWQTWFASGGHQAVESYARGIADGHFASWHEGGQLEHDATYQGGLAEGRERWWSKDGVLLSDGNFHLGLAEGPFATFDEVGAPVSTGAYLHGREVGTWRRYAGNGDVDAVEQWDDGVLVHVDTRGEAVAPARRHAQATHTTVRPRVDRVPAPTQLD
jgi:antitoxin component YwqK of YwqJK toxin-antitoxin module